MALLSWFDNRTLLACQFILAVVFSTVFLVMQRVYPMVKGLRSAAIAFLLGTFGCAAVFLRGWIPGFVSIVLGNLLVLSAVIFVYDAIVRFTGARRLTNYFWPLMAPATAVLWYNSSVRHNIVPRIVVMSLICGFVMAFTASVLLARSSAFSSRFAMRFQGIFLFCWVGVEIYRATMTSLYGAPQNYMVSNPTQTLALTFNFFYICVSALCFLFIASHELITRIRVESERDSLSGTLNRRGIESRLAAEMKRLRRGRQGLSIALIDIDHFKPINDGYGHALGDETIRRVAETISAQLRAYDSLGRFGGDEFLLLLPHALPGDAFTIVDRLGSAVSNLSIDGLPHPVTISIGLTEAIPEEDASTALARADEALYQAKRDGRNRRTILWPTPTPVSRPFPAAIP